MQGLHKKWFGVSNLFRQNFLNTHTILGFSIWHIYFWKNFFFILDHIVLIIVCGKCRSRDRPAETLRECLVCVICNCRPDIGLVYMYICNGCHKVSHFLFNWYQYLAMNHLDFLYCYFIYNSFSTGFHFIQGSVLGGSRIIAPWTIAPRTIVPGQLPPTIFFQFYFGGFMLFYALWFDWLSIFPVSIFNSMW